MDCSGAASGQFNYGNKIAMDALGFLLLGGTNTSLAFTANSNVFGTKDTGLVRGAAGLLRITDGSQTFDGTTDRDFIGRFRVEAVETIASATTIAPVKSLVHITGTATIQTITPPTNLATTGQGGCIRLIPDGLFSTNTSGNIALASTAAVSRVLQMCYDNATSKWYPSY